VTSGTPSTRAAKEATTTLPIVMTVTGDAVGSGLIASLARPGGNLTGATYFDPELTGKRFELLKEAVPRIAHLAAFVNPLNPQAMGTALQALQVVTKVKKVALEVFEARGPNEFDNAFSAMAKKRVDAVEVVDDAMFISNFKAIATLAASKRLPSTGTKEFAEAGGLIGYGVSFDATHNRAAYFIDRIFKGAKPSDLPVEQATRFELVVNLTTAKALGIKIPESILLQANKLIE